MMYKQKVDMRMNFEGWRNLVEQGFEYNIIKDNKYVFISRSKKIMKILEYKINGWVMVTRKLDKGTFDVKLESRNFIEISGLELSKLIL